MSVVQNNYPEQHPPSHRERRTTFDEPVTVCVRKKYEAFIHETPNVDEVVEERSSDGRLLLLLKRKNNTVTMFDSWKVAKWSTKRELRTYRASRERREPRTN